VAPSQSPTALRKRVVHRPASTPTQDEITAALKVVGHPIRRGVLDAMEERDIGLSATDLAQLLGESVKAVWYHLNELDKLGAIEEVGTAQSRGALQRFYRPLVRWSGTTSGGWVIVRVQGVAADGR
jgi:hypothetical protein